MKKIASLIILMALVLVLSGCTALNNLRNSNQASDTENQNQDTESGHVTEQTDYVIFYTEPSPPVPGGITVQNYIIGQPTVEAATIKQNAYFVPWKIQFSQVQRMTLTSLVGCENVTEQVVEIEGWIDLSLAELAVGPDNLPNTGPVSLSGTINETVTGTPGTWQCETGPVTSAANTASIEYVQSVSGMHTANFSGDSHMTNMTVDGAKIYLDFSYEEYIQMIWPAGTVIEHAPEGTPIPLEPLAPSSL